MAKDIMKLSHLVIFQICEHVQEHVYVYVCVYVCIYIQLCLQASVRIQHISPTYWSLLLLGWITTLHVSHKHLLVKLKVQ